MQHFIKKAAALALAMVMALSLASVAFAADFPDMPDDWSTAALEAAVENGLISGKDGKIAASDNLTRAEMATIITRAFGAEVEDDISFADVKNDAWYKSAVAKAVHMGAMGGVGSNNFAGAASITRQEVFVVLARVLKLADGDAADLATFSDADKTATWAVPAVAALVKSGYVSGSNGALNPTANITRAEFSQVMYNIFHNAYLTKAGTYEEVDGDNVIISSTNVTVKGVDVKGDVVIADGVGDGDVFFEDVTIGGRLVVRGGGMNSVHFKDSKVGTVIMSKVDGNVRLVVTGESTVETVTVEAGKASTDVRVEGTVGTVVVNDNASTVVLADATVAKVEVNKANTTVSLAGKTVVAEMTVAAGATGTNINAEPNTEITKLDTAEELTINNEDAIKDCNDEEKVNPERPEESGKPEESKAPGEDTGSNTTAHTHVFTQAYNSTTGKMEDVVATYDANNHAYTCKDCGEKILRAHDSKGADGACSVCGQAKPTENTSTIGDITGAVNRPEGVTESCAEDEHTWVDAKDQTGTTAYNCATGGTVNKVCSTCGDTATETLSGTGVHTFGPETWAKVTVKDASGKDVQIDDIPSCTTAGHKEATCTVCGAKSAQSTIAASGTHKANGIWSSDETTHWQTCANARVTNAKADAYAIDCTQKLKEAEHTFVVKQVTVDVQDTPTAMHQEVCSVCGYEKDAAEHNTNGYKIVGDKHIACCDVVGCGFVAKDAVAEAHTYGTWSAEDMCNKCACGAKDTANVHKITYQQVTTENGTLAHVATCSIANCEQHHNTDKADPVACTYTLNNGTTCVCGRTHTHNFTVKQDKSNLTATAEKCEVPCTVTGCTVKDTITHTATAACTRCGKHAGEHKYADKGHYTYVEADGGCYGFCTVSGCTDKSAKHEHAQVETAANCEYCGEPLPLKPAVPTNPPQGS